MPRPRRTPAFAVLVAGALVVATALLAAGCSTPTTAPGTLAAGRRRVVALVLRAAHALPPTVDFRPPSVVGTPPCRRTVAGYAIGATGAHRAEVPMIVMTGASRTAVQMLPLLERTWTAAGYRLDRSRMTVPRFPQLRAHVPGGYDVVATAFDDPAHTDQNHQLDLYAVSPCLRGR